MVGPGRRDSAQCIKWGQGRVCSCQSKMWPKTHLIWLGEGNKNLKEVLEEIGHPQCGAQHGGI